MPDTDRLAARLDAVERALTDGDHDLDSLSDAAALSARVDELDARTTELESGLAELEAAVRALRGYVGNVDAVNEAVERRADAALAAAEGAGDAGGTGREPLSGELGVADEDAGWRDAAATERSAGGSAPVPGSRDGPPDGDSSVEAGERHPGPTDGQPGATDGQPGRTDRSDGDSSRRASGRDRDGWTGDGSDRWLDRHDRACPTCGDAPTPEPEPDGSRDSGDADLDPGAARGSDDGSLLDRLGEVL